MSGISSMRREIETTAGSSGEASSANDPRVDNIMKALANFADRLTNAETGILSAKNVAQGADDHAKDANKKSTKAISDSSQAIKLAEGNSVLINDLYDLSINQQCALLKLAGNDISSISQCNDY